MNGRETFINTLKIGDTEFGIGDIQFSVADGLLNLEITGDESVFDEIGRR